MLSMSLQQASRSFNYGKQRMHYAFIMYPNVCILTTVLAHIMSFSIAQSV